MWPLMPLPSSGRFGAFDSATSTSPLGSTSSQRGWSRPLANAATASPCAAFGVAFAGQPLAVAMLMVGMRDLLGAGRVGLGPLLASNGRLAESPQPLNKKRDTRATRADDVVRIGILRLPDNTV